MIRLRCRGSVARAAARARLDRVRGQAASGSIQRTFVSLAVSPSSAIPRWGRQCLSLRPARKRRQNSTLQEVSNPAGDDPLFPDF
jgi:hypothetical protein